MSFDLSAIRKEFPVLDQKVYGKELVYLDSAASSQKPISVLKKEEDLHNSYYGNIHRAAHYMADKATVEYEAVRESVKEFIGAESKEEIIFTKGTTESINLVAFSYGERFVQKGDEIIVSEMEHHSNIVPWQLMAERKGARIVKWSFDAKGELDLDELKRLISSKTKLITLAHVSNVLGTINPVKEVAELAHAHGVHVFVDGAQAVQHLEVNVKDFDLDFYAFSAHKMYGPNGVGILYGKKDLLNEMPPYQGGGEMISEVSFEKTTFNELPYKFEAGTPNITSVIAFGSAIDFVNSIGLEQIKKWEDELLDYALARLAEVEGVKIYGESSQKSSLISFNIDGVHSYDLGMLLDKMGIALRTGHLCADTVMAHFNVPGMIRISFGVYNTKEEIDKFMTALLRVRSML